MSSDPIDVTSKSSTSVPTVRRVLWLDCRDAGRLIWAGSGSYSWLTCCSPGSLNLVGTSEMLWRGLLDSKELVGLAAEMWSWLDPRSSGVKSRTALDDGWLKVVLLTKFRRVDRYFMALYIWSAESVIHLKRGTLVRCSKSRVGFADWFTLVTWMKMRDTIRIFIMTALPPSEPTFEVLEHVGPIRWASSRKTLWWLGRDGRRNMVQNGS